MLSAMHQLLKKLFSGGSPITAPTQRGKKPFILSFQGIDCEVTFHRISAESYGIGIKTDLPLNTKYIHSIRQYLEKEGFIDTFLEHDVNTLES